MRRGDTITNTFEPTVAQGSQYAFGSVRNSEGEKLPSVDGGLSPFGLREEVWSQWAG